MKLSLFVYNDHYIITSSGVRKYFNGVTIKMKYYLYISEKNYLRKNYDRQIFLKTLTIFYHQQKQVRSLHHHQQTRYSKKSSLTVAPMHPTVNHRYSSDLDSSNSDCCYHHNTLLQPPLVAAVEPDMKAVSQLIRHGLSQVSKVFASARSETLFQPLLIQ